MNGKDKASYVTGMFSAIAARYDLLNSWLSLGRDRSWRKFAVAQCAVEPVALVLDICSGTGEVARWLALEDSRSRVIGLDFNRNMLARARAKLTKPGGDRIHLVMGDALHLPFPDNTFSCATIGFALRNVADIAGTFHEMRRVVKPGGRVVSLELTRPSSPLVRAVYYLYLFRVAPFIGGMVSGKREAYTYLPESILEFPSPEEVARMMQAAGLPRVKTYRLTFGAATVHVGVKYP